MAGTGRRVVLEVLSAPNTCSTFLEGSWDTQNTVVTLETQGKAQRGGGWAVGFQHGCCSWRTRVVCGWEVWDEHEEDEGGWVPLPFLETQTMTGSWGWSWVGAAGHLLAPPGRVQAEPGAELRSAHPLLVVSGNSAPYFNMTYVSVPEDLELGEWGSLGEALWPRRRGQGGALGRG